MDLPGFGRPTMLPTAVGLDAIFCLPANSLYQTIIAMHEAEELSALIADIYDTAIEPTSWPHVLAKICAFVPGCGSNLFSQDALCRVAQVHYSCGDDPHYVQLYLDKYIKMNPFFPAISFGEVGRVGTQSDIIPFDEFHETRFYREWAQPQGYVDCLFCLLEKTEAGCAMITVRRDVHNGLVDDELCRRLRLIAPHIRRAVLISRALEHSEAATDNLTNMLDHMSAGVFLIGAAGRITYVNRAGRILLSQHLTSKKGDLSIVLKDTADAVLTDLTTRRGQFDVGIDGVAEPFVDKRGEQYVAHVLPLTSGIRRLVGNAHAAVAAAFVRKARIGWSSPAETIAKIYRLTPSEIRVLPVLVEEGGVPQVAIALGISEETVKTHLKHIFEKTGKRRQADLVKLLAEFAQPI